MISEKRPSLFRVIQIDYWAFIAAVFTVLFWVFYLYDTFIRKNVTINLLYWLVAITIISLAVILWRYGSMLSIYGSGLEAKAVVSGAGFFRDRGYISFIYTYQGQKYQSRVSVMRTKRTARFQVGDEIDVLVDRENPKRAVIRDLYV